MDDATTETEVHITGSWIESAGRAMSKRKWTVCMCWMVWLERTIQPWNAERRESNLQHVCYTHLKGLTAEEDLELWAYLGYLYYKSSLEIQEESGSMNPEKGTLKEDIKIMKSEICRNLGDHLLFHDATVLTYSIPVLDTISDLSACIY